MNINYNSINSIKLALKSKNIAPRKIWGQNYLINEQIREKIVDSLEIKKNEKIWEIGPGLGAMTTILLKKTNFLTAFEIDPKYSEILNEQFGKFKNFKLTEGNFLKTYKREEQNINKIFSNLPYNIASKVISVLIEDEILKHMVFTVQKELANRMLAKKGNKNYSSFTVLVQSHFNVIKIMDIDKKNFYPIPKVQSTTLKLIPCKGDIKDFKAFNKLIRTVFTSRRKKLKNTIINFVKDKSILQNDFLKKFLDKRPEEISVKEFIIISNKLTTDHQSTC
ncbi:Ribosomal RNA small subunit methyltransferase A [Borrelia miyamotoi]|uniref:Ribosomal RNA small subunit methyltransferase A n=1 Tax=Borrelia miyamotoi TaxID=47466 RepID=A0AAP8YTY6_9SPIR|nr:16S rRNA (adenine(1518)-N(6)/adenine(1519)-N(6))-dimethyltransferase RsmA [Borrelia miyamotoi]MCZ6925522.1 16S rRNA (adenine(1518)-N(6)/adenine(1519)-N(6))-dimethyltransferase RsmA [Rickettsia endosymbiont of Ixodes persulcatus]ATQ14655.1 16S rRNA (adenine(1518)-N(6)/adenine(1519)-N(6))-dimethyltransferase RsmA [Borrelia miyamotoi]ATQ15839.1 16S rRNA (adenine(1518)-N(6)/adenine(1519)-N(6))-dimethyltransferase RsmA [Borrelia miyamotoi]ATQ16984.1 16S rRNA (adenine(1518)-N(6)/adenine(1519)-N(6)